MKRTALITGSTSGIGLGIAKALAAKNYNIVFNGLEENGAEIARKIAEEHDINFMFSNTNLLDTAATEVFARQALEKFEHIDVLVNNAGIQYVSAVEEFPLKKWDAIIGLNLTAAFVMTKALWPKMKAQKFGRIINIASAHGLVASAFKSAYVASKHGLIGFTKTIALEGAPFGITANAICPGYVHTPIIDKQVADQMKVHDMTKEEVIEKVMLDKQAIKEFIPIERVAAAVAFLADDQNSTMTGVALPIDGGWTAE